MENLLLVERLLNDIELEPLSKSIPYILSLALECKDYKGYCILSNLAIPLSDNKRTNDIQTNEIIKILISQGLAKEYIAEIIQESREEVIEIKSIDKEQVSSHSIKEIEDWLPEARKLLETVKNTPNASYSSLIQRITKVKRLYEEMRGYIITKLTYYNQVLKNQNCNECKGVCKMNTNNKSKVFIVHGHDDSLKESVARLIEKQGIQAIILHEQVNQGDTIIEKFERNSDVGAAICLFTADDVGRAKSSDLEYLRARQNVVFETGYFIGCIGRKNIVLVADKGVEIPSDLQGIVYTDSLNWRLNVLKELKAIGYNIDYNKLD